MRIEVVSCPGHADAVDIVDTGAGDDSDPLHVSLWEWEEFTAAVKDGRYDNLRRRDRPEPQLSAE